MSYSRCTWSSQLTCPKRFHELDSLRCNLRENPLSDRTARDACEMLQATEALRDGDHHHDRDRRLRALLREL